jgi:excisionase family DNA binding protein
MPVTTSSNGSGPLRPLLSISEVAEVLGVEVRHVRRLVHERRIPFIKWGHLLRFEPTGDPGLDRWVPPAPRSAADRRVARRPSTHSRRADLRDPHARAAPRALQRARRQRAGLPGTRRRTAAEEQLPTPCVAARNDQGRRPQAAVPRPAPHGRDAGRRERNEPEGAHGSHRPLVGGRRAPLPARRRRPGRGDRSLPGALRPESARARWGGLDGPPLSVPGGHVEGTTLGRPTNPAEPYGPDQDFLGGDDGTRTHDPLLAKQVL